MTSVLSNLHDIIWKTLNGEEEKIKGNVHLQVNFKRRMFNVPARHRTPHLISDQDKQVVLMFHA